MSPAKVIAAAVMRRWRESFFLPNYTPFGWWECDVFELTKAGYFREYEIKVTRGDFFRDAEKARTRLGSGLLSTATKYEDMTNPAQANRPTRFWYVTPPGLLKLDEVPEWAGLYECDLEAAAKHRGSLNELRAAPKLHGEPLAPEVVKHAHGVCYYRFHELRTKRR